MKLLPTREGFVEDATFLRTSEGCALVNFLPTCEGFVEDITFLRTSKGCAMTVSCDLVASCFAPYMHVPQLCILRGGWTR